MQVSADHNQKERKELAACETAYQLRVGFAQIFEHDPKDRVADEKQSGQNSIWLACARPHKPQNRKQDNPFEKRFVKLRRMTRRQNGVQCGPNFRLAAYRVDDRIRRG